MGISKSLGLESCVAGSVDRFFKSLGSRAKCWSPYYSSYSPHGSNCRGEIVAPLLLDYDEIKRCNNC